jgi:hypothetical protein
VPSGTRLWMSMMSPLTKPKQKDDIGSRWSPAS